MHTYTVEPLYVLSGDETIAADFYLPKAAIKPAVIVMAHGFAGLRQFKLVQYAQRFAQAGYAVFLILTIVSMINFVMIKIFHVILMQLLLEDVVLIPAPVS